MNLLLIFVTISGCEAKVEKVLGSSDEEHQQPFKDKMDAFLTKG